MPGLDRPDTEAVFAPVAGAQTLALAVSGGPDSLALMLLAAGWASAPGRPQLIVYSVDHGLRPEAASEVAMVLHEAHAIGLEARGLRWEGDKPETGIQAGARKARYGMLAATMAEDGAELLLTAHHLGDQAETVLMRLAHGSGIDGLRGMDAFATVEGCSIFRPLLGVDPEELAQVVERAGLIPAADPSNRDRHYERVRWRQIMPALAELGLEPRRFGKFAQRMAQAASLINDLADAAAGRLAEIVEDGGRRLPYPELVALNPLVAARLLGQLLAAVSADHRDPPLGAVEALVGKLRAHDSLKPTTLHGCVISSDGATVRIVREGPRTADLKARGTLTAD